MLKRVSEKEYEKFIATKVGTPGFFRATASDIQLTDTGLTKNCTEEKIYAPDIDGGELIKGTIIGLCDIKNDYWISTTPPPKAINPISRIYMVINTIVLNLFKR